MSLSLHIADESSMRDLGATLAFACQIREDAPIIIHLNGPLGAGKTTLVRGFLRALGYIGQVKSPTYTLVEPYELDHIKVFHFDFYRLKDPNELEWMGIQDYFSPKAICLIEWAELGHLTSPDIVCQIEMPVEVGRNVKLTADSDYGKVILERLQK